MSLKDWFANTKMRDELIASFQADFQNHLRTGNQWSRPNAKGNCYHVPFNAKAYLEKFPEDVREEISKGFTNARIRTDQRFGQLRALLASLSEEELLDVLEAIDREQSK